MHEPNVGGIVFNPEACNGCGRCMESCQFRALHIGPERNRRGAYPVQFVSEKCMTCGTCYYFCPQLGAIQFSPRKTPGRAPRYIPAA
jgi:2-oxoisovalerate ferredoxin oxidoreductase delta subunit